MYGDQVKTIAMTGKLTDGLKDHLIRLKVDKILGKPFLISALKEVIFDLIKE
ncbi:hypothetical protein MJH12_15050 [bacterium]|nr:hypothetical protein [bacterium]